jgi:hypothetical protein
MWERPASHFLLLLLCNAGMFCAGYWLTIDKFRFQIVGGRLDKYPANEIWDSHFVFSLQSQSNAA